MANVLYVDQPVGTGFSYVKDPFGYVTNEREIATELWDFIRQFYQLYPKYSQLDLYVFGESYGEAINNNSIVHYLLTVCSLCFGIISLCCVCVGHL